jgi:ketosteroid isomerase-like protein
MNRDAADIHAVPPRMDVSPDWSTGPVGWQGSFRRARSGILRGLIVVLLLGLGACTKPPEEERLRAAIAAMQAAAEARQPGGVVDHVSEEFSGSHGLDREQLRRLMQAQMFGRNNIGVTLGPLDIVIEGDHAEVRFLLLTTGGGRLLPEQARGYRVESGWRIEDGEWRVYRATWDAERD